MKRTGSRSASRLLTLSLRVANPPPRRAHGAREVAARTKVAVAVDQKRELREGPPRRPVNDGSGAGGIERRVVAGTDKRRVRLDHREGRLAIQRDGTTGVGADLRVGEDPHRRPGSALRRQLKPPLMKPHDDDRGGKLLLVGALRERGVEAADL